MKAEPTPASAFRIERSVDYPAIRGGGPATHSGYAREHWFDIVWLCRIHHAAAHTFEREGGAK